MSITAKGTSYQLAGEVSRCRRIPPEVSDAERMKKKWQKVPPVGQYMRRNCSRKSCHKPKLGAGELRNNDLEIASGEQHQCARSLAVRAAVGR